MQPVPSKHVHVFITLVNKLKFMRISQGPRILHILHDILAPLSNVHEVIRQILGFCGLLRELIQPLLVPVVIVLKKLILVVVIKSDN